MKKYKDYATPVYTSNLGDRGTGFLAGAFLYIPLVITESDLPHVDVVGVEGALSCIGIIARDPKSKTILVFHMKEPQDRTVSFALLNFAFKSGFVPSEDHDSVEKLLHDISEQKSGDNKYANEAYDYIKKQDFFKNMQFTIVNTNPRSYEQFLSMLENVGVRKSNIAIDNDTDKILIDRKTGLLCADFDVDKTKLPKPPPSEEELKETLLIQRKNQADAEFSALPLQEKLKKFEKEGIILVQDKKLVFTLNHAMQAYAKLLPPAFYGELLAHYSQHTGINALAINMGEVNSFHTYQDIPKLLIEQLDSYPEIKALSIRSSPPLKTNYLSMYAVEAGNALKSHGKHLTDISVVANTRGANSFNQAVDSLKSRQKDLNAQITLVSGAAFKPS